MKNEKNYMGFRIPKVWQILKHFAGTFHWAQTLKLWGVTRKVQRPPNYVLPAGHLKEVDQSFPNLQLLNQNEQYTIISSLIVVVKESLELLVDFSRHISTLNFQVQPTYIW